MVGCFIEGTRLNRAAGGGGLLALDLLILPTGTRRAGRLDPTHVGWGKRRCLRHESFGWCPRDVTQCLYVDKL